MKKLLVIDNYDSFVYNAVQLLREAACPVRVEVRLNDRIEPAMSAACDGVLLSPGPGLPAEAGRLREAIREIVRMRIPVLGICLGHQALAEAFGARLEQLPAPLHGHPSALRITDPDDILLRGLTAPAVVGRYHSWVVAPGSLPPELAVSSLDEQGHVMSFYHRTLPVHGVQFHPESYISDCGRRIIHNWLGSL